MDVKLATLIKLLNIVDVIFSGFTVNEAYGGFLGVVLSMQMHIIAY